MVLTLDAATLGELLRGSLSPDEAKAAGRVKIVGEASGLHRFVKLFATQAPPRS